MKKDVIVGYSKTVILGIEWSDQSCLVRGSRSNKIIDSLLVTDRHPGHKESCLQPEYM